MSKSAELGWVIPVVTVIPHTRSPREESAGTFTVEVATAVFEIAMATSGVTGQLDADVSTANDDVTI